jgi:tRNA 2-selenouridine synthase
LCAKPFQRVSTLPQHVILLHGLTGAGKTRLLDELSQLGEQVINLEQLANHSGSVFGGLGRSPQPSHDAFQQLVSDAWSAADPERLLWIEDEGPFIGSVGLPLWLLEKFPHLPVVEVVAEQEERISRIVEDYGSIATADLEAALCRLDQRFGRSRVASAVDAIRAGRLRDAVEMVLEYYDGAYRHRMSQQNRKVVATYDSSANDARDLIRLVRSAVLKN